MNVAIVGLGLIGGSFFKAAQAAGHEVIALHHGDPLPNPNPQTPQTLSLSSSSSASSRMEYNRPFSSSNSNSHFSTLILVCLPPEAIVPWIREHATSFKKGAVVVDICGVKRPIMREVREAKAKEKVRGEGEQWWFVGGHPMAGREVSGFANSKADLFVGASMILTPPDGTPDETLAMLKEFFASVGFAETVVTTPEKHDDMIAFTSQLCHIIATTYSRDPRVKEAVGFSAGSYANMTRIATQDSDVWSSLYLSNRDALVGVLDDFAARFKALRDAVAAGDVAEMKRLIDEGTKAKRQELLDRKRGDENV